MDAFLDQSVAFWRVHALQFAPPMRKCWPWRSITIYLTRTGKAVEDLGSKLGIVLIPHYLYSPRLSLSNT